MCGAFKTQGGGGVTSFASTIRRVAIGTIAMLAAAASSHAQEFDNLRVGRVVRLDFDVRLDTDLRSSHDVDAIDRLTWPGRRIGVSGALFDRLEFEVSGELGDERQPWRDAFVNVRGARALEVKAGRFKVPFSRERLTSLADLDFVHRSYAAATLAPGRTVGVMAHGKFAGRRLGYEVGVFGPDAEEANVTSELQDVRTHGPMYAARFTVRPLAGPNACRDGCPSALFDLDTLQLGVAGVVSEIPEGLSGLGSRLYSNRDDVIERVYVNGRRRRSGVDLSWKPGSLALAAEYMRVSDERRAQGLGGEDLAALDADGWYVSGVWRVRLRQGSDASLEDGRKSASWFRAVEFGTRLEGLRFTSGSPHPDDAWTPRAANLPARGLKVWTLGVNWEIHRMLRAQANAIREALTAAEALSDSPPSDRWTGVLRLQFKF
jgi:phosphate-selective porin